MKIVLKAIVMGLALSLASAGALADRGHGHRFRDTAKVIEVTPLYETVEVNRPEERCWVERVRHIERVGRRDYAPTIVGGVVGGVVGNQLGRKRNRDLFTVAGAVLGAAVGHQYSDRDYERRVYFTKERRCEQVDRYIEEEELVGYRVKYRYRGKIFTTRTKEYPGRRIRVKVGVRPIERIAYNDH
jgi:uncharacterized protein YcfJ